MATEVIVAVTPFDNRSDFRVVNDFAGQTGWLHGFFTFFATYGIGLFVLLLVAGWWRSRRDGSPTALPRLLWTPVAALLAVAVNQPIVAAVHEKRPFVALPHVLTLIHHAANSGFPSDHATACGALAAGLVVASRRLGWPAALLALLVAFSRVYVGVHYPGDVLAGLALGAAVTLIGLRPATWLLGQFTDALGRSRLAPLVRAEPAEAAPTRAAETAGAHRR